MTKNPTANAEDVGSIPGSGRSPGEGNSNPLQDLAWEIPGTEEPGGVQFMGSHRVGHNLATKTTALVETVLAAAFDKLRLRILEVSIEKDTGK